MIMKRLIHTFKFVRNQIGQYMLLQFWIYTETSIDYVFLIKIIYHVIRFIIFIARFLFEKLLIIYFTGTYI